MAQMIEIVYEAGIGILIHSRLNKPMTEASDPPEDEYVCELRAWSAVAR